MAVAKAELGTKRQCPKCGERFYDLGKDDPITCIGCEHTFYHEPILKPRRPVAAETPAKPVEKKKEEEAEDDEDDVLSEADDLLEIDDDDDDDDESADSVLEIDDDDDDVSAEIGVEVDIESNIEKDDK